MPNRTTCTAECWARFPTSDRDDGEGEEDQYFDEQVAGERPAPAPYRLVQWQHLQGPRADDDADEEEQHCHAGAREQPGVPCDDGEADEEDIAGHDGGPHPSDREETDRICPACRERQYQKQQQQALTQRAAATGRDEHREGHRLLRPPGIPACALRAVLLEVGHLACGRGIHIGLLAAAAPFRARWWRLRLPAGHFTTTGFSLRAERAAIVFWSTLRWACTSSGGVSASHWASDTSMNRGLRNISRKVSVSVPVFST